MIPLYLVEQEGLCYRLQHGRHRRGDDDTLDRWTGETGMSLEPTGVDSFAHPYSKAACKIFFVPSTDDLFRTSGDSRTGKTGMAICAIPSNFADLTASSNAWGYGTRVSVHFKKIQRTYEGDVWDNGIRKLIGFGAQELLDIVALLRGSDGTHDAETVLDEVIDGSYGDETTGAGDEDLGVFFECRLGVELV